MFYGSLGKGKAQVKDCQIALNLEEEIVHIVFREMISGTSQLCLNKLLWQSYHSMFLHVITRWNDQAQRWRLLSSKEDET